MSFDPNLTPARPDLAAAHLQGVVDAARFVDGALFQVSAPIAPIRRARAHDAPMDTQLLFGDGFTVYEERDGWAWGQALRDGYVGFTPIEALSAPLVKPTHRVAALRSYVFCEESIKSAPVMLLSMNAAVTIEAQGEKLSRIARGGWITTRHLAPIDSVEPDWVAVAEKFVGAPYFWGGKESLGLDCSGLIQNAVHAAGHPCQRDTYMQERSLGRDIPYDPSALQRGDLLYWPGHVGVMVDGNNFLHANAFFMATVIEPVADVLARTGPPRTVRRL
jgi:cell wall-associated NlpC family hydrolase